MDRFNIRKIEGYTIMSNHHLRDKNLSHAARGLLSFLLSLPEDWDYSFNGLVAISKEGKSAIRSMINELKSAKYINISPYRNEKGYFQYNYDVYEIPYDTPLKIAHSPTPENQSTVSRKSVNQPQINTKEQKKNKEIDKIDKTNISHNILTLELINLQYITENDISSFYFDDLFKEYLSEGYTYKDLASSIHYIVPRVISRNFIDEDGNKIENKFGYLKHAIDSNFKKFNNLSNLSRNGDMYDDYEL